jgi:hypothetical protein
MFWEAAIVVFPLMLIYSAMSYSLFHGKVKPSEDH